MKEQCFKLHWVCPVHYNSYFNGEGKHRNISMYATLYKNVFLLHSSAIRLLTGKSR